jgi:phospholipase/lecithinase/hemolysin
MKLIRPACLAAAAAALSAPTLGAAPQPFDQMVVFGHSYCDNGNDHILSGGIVAAPPYDEGQFSNGPLWIEQLADRLGLAMGRDVVPAPSEAGGTNYAYGGADTGSGFSDACIGVGSGKVCAPNVGLQIEMFFADGGTLDGDELIVIQAGDNDNNPTKAAQNMGQHIAVLAAAGGRAFLVPNISRISQDPGRKSASSADDHFTATFNGALDEELDALESIPGITIFRFDLLGLQDLMIATPEDFGLSNVTDPACPGCGSGIPAPDAEDTVVSNPDEFMYWDLVHFTRVVQKFVGDAAADLVLGGSAADTVVASASTAAQIAVAAPSVHVALVETSVVWTGHGKLRGGHRYYGMAAVLIVDHLGNPVPGAQVTGTFSSDLLRKSETISGFTGPDGWASLRSNSAVSGPAITFTFCVDHVAASVPYNPADNVMTCDAGSL